MDSPMRPRKQGSRLGAPSCSGMRAWCCKDRGPEHLGGTDSIVPSAIHSCISWAAYHRNSLLLTQAGGCARQTCRKTGLLIPLPPLPPGWSALKSVNRRETRMLGASICCSWVLLRFPPIFNGLPVSLVLGAQ